MNVPEAARQMVQRILDCLQMWRMLVVSIQNKHQIKCFKQSSRQWISGSENNGFLKSQLLAARGILSQSTERIEDASQGEIA